MSENACRIALRERLLASDPLATLVPAGSIFSAGAMEGTPEIKPFLVIRLDPRNKGSHPGSSVQMVSLWAHDQPGSYLGIGDVLSQARLALVGSDATQPAFLPMEGSHALISWLGTSDDLADDSYGTIVKYSTYQINGRET